MRTRSLLILFVLAVFGSCISEDADKGSQGANLVVGDSLPTFQVTMNDGSTVSTADLLGSVSVVVFFSVDCGDCRVELPVVQRLWDLQLGKIRKRPFNCFGNSTISPCPIRHSLTARSIRCLPFRAFPVSIFVTARVLYAIPMRTTQCRLLSRWQTKSRHC